MPATTPNRAYPYPVPADPVDVPGDMQRFAEAVDADLCTLTASIPLRPAFRLSANDAVRTTSSPPLNPYESLTFDTEDFNTGLPYTITITSVVNEGVVCVVRPQVAGFFWVHGAIAIPRPTDGTNRIEVRAEIRRETGTIMAAESSHLQPSASDGIRTGAIATGLELNGSTEGVQLGFFSRTAAGGLDRYTVVERSITVIRMSPTFP